MEEKTKFSALDEVKKQYLKHCVILVASILIIYAVIFAFINLKAGIIFFAIPAIVCIYLYFFLTRYRAKFSLIHDFGLYTFSIFLYLFIVFFHNQNNIVFIWPLTIIMSVYLFKSTKETIYWIIAILLTSISAPFIANFFNVTNYITRTTEQLSYTNLSTAISTSLIIGLNFIYLNKINKAKQNDLLAQIKAEHEEVKLKTIIEQKTETVKNAEYDKFTTLYNEIEKYFNKKNNYKKADFNINILSEDLKSNVSYISKALNSKGGTNFKAYLNKHRINEVTKTMNSGTHKTFTLKSIYTEVGFTNQSTFNRVFKEIEGVTPSQYIENL
jgi:AraC-like DNA-binding protein